MVMATFVWLMMVSSAWYDESSYLLECLEYKAGR
jgi:hypothetical protein